MRSRRQRRRIGMRSIAVLLIAAMLGTGLPAMPVMAAETQSISSEDPTQKDTLLSTQEPGNSEEETDSSEGENPPGETDPSEGENPPGETDPSEGENPPGETDPSEETNPPEETDPSKEGDPSGETDPSEEEIPEETVSENTILQSDITVSGNEADDSIYRPPYLPLIEPIELPESGVPASLQTYINDRAGFASSYDSRNEGILSPIRNQNPWGTCWAFATLGAMESSLRKQGLGNFDLSERHLAYFAYHTRSDVLGNASGDTIEPVNSSRSYLEYGGNIMTSVSALMNWQGAADESNYQYVNSRPEPPALSQAVSQDTAAILKDCYLLETKANDAATIQNVKALVQQYGCVMWTYYDDTPYYNSTHHAYYNNVTQDATNHAIMVVGWDDNYSKENFNTPPTNNGAWIVRNSWSDSWGEKGYFYISYEDTSLGSGNPASAMIAGLREEYDNNYFNSNTISASWKYDTKLAQVYTIKGRKADAEQLRAVSFLTGSLNTDYSIQIYKNPDKVNGVVENPESGTPLLSKPVSGRITYQGLYTVDLTQPVTVEKGDVIAIVITFPNGGYIYADVGSSDIYNCHNYNEIKKGESFTSYSGKTWSDLADSGYSLRINALTRDIVSTVSVPVVTVEDARIEDFDGHGVVQLKWNACAGAERYEVWRGSSQAGNFTKIADRTAYERSYQDRDISAGSTYYYKVKAFLNNGSTSESEAVAAETPTKVACSDISVSIVNMEALLSWNEVKGATGYEIYRKAPGESGYKKIADVSILSYTDDLSSSALGDYEYKMRAYNGQGAYTEWSDPKCVSFSFILQQAAYNQIKFTWSKYPGAAKYELYMMVGSWKVYWQLNSTTMLQNMTKAMEAVQLSEFKVGDDYTYGLRVLDSNNKEIYEYPSVTFRTVPEVSLKKVSYEEGKGITLEWKSDAAQQIEIYRSTMPKKPDAPYTTVGDAGANSYTDTDIKGGTGYYYWLCPTLTNSSGELVQGAVTGSKYISIPLLTTTTVLESVQAHSGTEAVITWESNPLSDGYYLYRSTKVHEQGVKIAEITDNKTVEYTDTGLFPGTVYYYSIAACVSAGSEMKEDVLSPQIGVRMLPSVPVLKQPALSGNRVALQWERTEGADGYILERCVKEGTFAQIAEMDSAAAVQYEDADTIYDMLYEYRLKAYNTDIDGNRQYTEVSNTVEIATPITPAAITAVRAIDEHSLQIVWEDVPEAEEYALYRSENAAAGYTKIAGDITKADDADNMLDHTDDNCVTGKTYYYKVQVFKNGINSELELTKAASGYTKPAMPAVVRATHDTITIQNNPSYEYAISRTYQDASALLYKDSTESELTFVSLEPDSTYYIYVRTKQSVTEEEPVYGAALRTTTKIKTELVLSRTDVVVSKGNKVDITASLKPSNMHYTGLGWRAYRADGTPYVTEQVGSIFKVTGSDNKEILRITGNTLSATGGSTDKEVYLQAEVDALTARCHVVVNVPVTELAIKDFKVNGTAQSPSDKICVSDEIEVSVSYMPDYNADDIKCDWSTTNGNVLKITGSTDTTVTLRAEGIGDCVLKARTADGISIEQKITVQKKEEVYGIWLSDKELSDTDLSKVKATLDENGNFVAEGLKADYEFDLDQDTTDSITVYAYALTADNAETGEDGRVTGGSLVRTSDCSYRSANPLIAEVSAEGVITAKANGETDIFAYDTTGNAVYGSCHIKVLGAKPKEETKTWPFDKAYKFSPVASAVSIHSYVIDGKSSAQLRIKDQFGNEYTPQENEKYFTFTSAKPSVCIVDEKGEITPNPAYKPSKNETVKVTATLDNDLGKRKVTFNVTILAVKQVDSIQMLSVNLPDDTQTQDAEAEYTPAPETVSVPFKAGDTMTFSAKAYDRFGKEMTGTALQWSVTDTSIAAVKLSKDKKYATVTFKKAGRTNLICQAKDTWKRSSSVQLVLLDTAVVPSEKQVTLNLCQKMEDNKRLSGEFQLRIPAGSDVDTLEIKQIKKGKEILTQDAARFSIIDKQNGNYSIAIDNSDDNVTGKGYADSIKNNTTYELTIGTTVKDLAEIGDQAETFTVKVKVVSKKPSVSVASPTIDRIYTQPEDLKALLVIKAPDVVESVHVPAGSEGQINQFDEYISIEKKGGQWYAVLDASKAYQKTSIKGKLALKVTGYEEVICNVTVKTPKKAKAVKQQTVPSIYIDTAPDAGGTNTADISLYNNTDKAVLTQMEVVSCTSAKLLVAAERDGTLKAAVKQNASYKNGETLTAKLQIMETDNAGNGLWADPVKVDIKVKVCTTTLPKAAIAQKTLTLNKKAPGEQAATTLKLDQQNASFTPGGEWEIYAYNNVSKKYDINVTSDGWQSITFDKESGMLRIGFQPDKAEGVAAGSYKFRITKHVKGHDDISTDLTVKVIDILPTAAVKVSGKLDLVNRDNMTLAGKLTVKNAVSQVKDVTIQAEDQSGAHPYFKAVYKGSNIFGITLTEEGRKAKLETKKYTLPVVITLEDGHEIKTELSFKPTQSVPKIKAPAAQTIYKYTGELTKDYNLSQSLPAGVRIAKIQAAKVPEGMGVVTKNGHVLVTLSDTGMKKGSYQVNANVYFEGEQELTGYPDGKPLSVKITVKVEN